LQRHFGMDINRVKFLNEFINPAQTFIGVVITIKPDAGIGRMIIGLVEALEILVGQVRDVRRVTTRVVTVDRIGKQ